MAVLHRWGMGLPLQISLNRCVMNSFALGPSSLMSSYGMVSSPGALLVLVDERALSTSSQVMSSSYFDLLVVISLAFRDLRYLLVNLSELLCFVFIIYVSFTIDD